MDQANQGSGTNTAPNPTTAEATPQAQPLLIQQEIYQPPTDFLAQSDDQLDSIKKSKVIEITGPYMRTARIKQDFKSDGNVKTVLGKKVMERYSMKAEAQSSLETGGEDPSRSKFYVAFRIDNLASTCVCVGIQEEGADLEKDSFEYKMSFQLNCRNGDIMRIGQQKKYIQPDVATVQNGSIVGMMVNLYDGELSFAIDDKFCGVASKDKRLKMGKFYTCILLLSPQDRVTLLNPDTVRQASHGYELIFSKLNMPKEQYSPFYNLFGRVQNHFSQNNTTNDLQRLLVMGFLNDRQKFDKLAAMILEVYKREHQVSTTSDEKQPGFENLPKSFASIQKEYIIRQFLNSHMTPNLISHIDFQDEYLKNAFEECQTRTIVSLMHFYFMITSLKQRLEGGTGNQIKESFVDLEVKSVAPSMAKSIAPSMAKSVAPSQMKANAAGDGADPKNGESKPEVEEALTEEWSKEVIESEIDFLSLRVHHLLCQYPQPKLTKEMERKLKDEENVFKFKLMEIKEKMMNMSTMQFDSISQGRVEKQTEDFCLTVSKTLFLAARRARTIIQEQEEQDEASSIDKSALNQKMMKKFDDFCGQLE